MFVWVVFFILSVDGGVMQPPLAHKHPYEIEIHGDRRIDNYYWMKNRDSKNVFDYLKAENKYTEYVMKDYKKIEKKIFNELKSMVKEEDESVKVRYKNYFYFKRYLKGKDYPVYYRQHINDGRVEELVDVNKLAEGKRFCDVSELKVSPDEKMVAFAADYVGRRFYTIYIKDISSKKVIRRQIKDVTSNFVWGSDSKTIYYVRQDPQTLRWYEVYSFNIDDSAAKLIYRENDPTYSVYVAKSLTERYVFIYSQSTLTTEVRYIDLFSNGDLSLFRKREDGVEYYVEDGGHLFFIKNNSNAKNFKISVIDKNSDTSDLSNWKDFIPHRSNVFIDDYEVFDKFVVVFEREKGVINLRVIMRDKTSDGYVKFNDSIYVVSPADNLDYFTDTYRYNYQSPINPPSVYDYYVKRKESVLIKRKEYPGYEPSNYATQRIWVRVRDGCKVPVSVVWKKGVKPERLFIYGYGAYGYSVDPVFDFTIFPLINRGFMYAIAHVRGGGELGREWYDNGRLLNKKNTFYDFIDITKYLINKGYGKKGVIAEGGSAGGLLMGAVANMAAELYTGIIAEVPFVDCLTTMLDESIPLTTSEYDEWGDPRRKEYYDYIKSYSPYDNVQKKAYPNILITASYYDSQVQYWEPAKWVAKLREYNTSNSLILLKTDMSSGHFGKTGRYNALRDIAFNYAFALKITQIKE